MPPRLRTGHRILFAALALGIAAGCAPKIEVEAPAKVTSPESEPAPAFSAVDHRGREVALSADAATEAITVLVFYRGAW